MKPLVPFRPLATLAGISLAALWVGAFASNAWAAPEGSEEVIELSPFVVSSKNITGYRAGESTSGGRVRASLFESRQPVTVLTRDFMNDVGTGVLLDSLKYVAGISQSTQAVGADRITIRGFQVDETNLIDGFATGGLNHQDPELFESIEVVRGPNAIVSPTAQPGGTVNLVSKSPLFTKDSAVIKAEIGQFNSTRGSIDVNRGLNKNLAVRVVLSGQHDDGYYHNFERYSSALAGVSWRFGASSNLTVKYIYHHSDVQNFIGLPTNPTTETGTADPRQFTGLARDANVSNPDDERFSRTNTVAAFYTVTLAKGLSMRLAGQYNDNYSWFNQFDTGLDGAAQGDYDPYTGAWVFGKKYTAIIDPVTMAVTGFTVGPAPGVPTTKFRRSSSGPINTRRFSGAVQNDWVYEFKSDKFTSLTQAGAAYNYTDFPYNLGRFLIRSSYDPVKKADIFDIFGPTLAPISGVSSPAPRLDQESSLKTKQLYFNETLKLFKDRLILNGGLSQSWFEYHLLDRVTPARSYDIELKGDLQASYGVVIMPMPDTSLYYGHSEVTNFNSAGVPPAPQTRDAKSDEVGVRQKLLDGKAVISLGYFSATQTNYSIPNPANLDPARAGLPALPGLFTDREASGWELELNASITRELSVVGSFTKLKNRDTNGGVFRGTAERSGALWVKYDFKEGAAKGLGLGLGITYLDRRPGDSPRSGYTAASTPTNLILYQPTFWIPAQTLVDASATYRFNAHWSARLMITNVFNSYYIDSALNRYMLELGPERNVRLQATYQF